MNEFTDAIAQRVEALEKAERERQEKDFMDRQITVINSTYNSATIYTNIIIIAGYASYFAAWGFLKDDLPDSQLMWSALLVTISAGVFVFFEVYKMIYSAVMLFWQAKILEKTDPISAIATYEQTSKTSLLYFMRIWVVALLVVIPTALIGYGLLLSGFISRLLN